MRAPTEADAPRNIPNSPAFNLMVTVTARPVTGSPLEPEKPHAARAGLTLTGGLLPLQLSQEFVVSTLYLIGPPQTI